MAKTYHVTDYPPLWELNPVWNELSFEEKEYLTRNVEVCHFKKNEIIHHEGDTPTHMMMLVEGKLRVYKEGVGNKQQIIRLLKPTDFFAYRAMIADEGYNTAVSAFEPSVVFKIRKEVFMRFITQNCMFCYKFMVAMARDLGLSDSKVVNLTQKHIRGRLAEALLVLKTNYGVDDDGATLSIFMSREDLANLSNMTTANAIRTLSEFQKDGIVSIDGRKIKLLDIPELMHMSKVG